MPTNTNDKKDPIKAKSEASEKIRREQERAKQDADRRLKNRAQIDLATQQGFLHSTESEIDRKKADIRTLRIKQDKIKLAERQLADASRSVGSSSGGNSDIVKIEKQLADTDKSSRDKVKDMEQKIAQLQKDLIAEKNQAINKTKELQTLLKRIKDASASKIQTDLVKAKNEAEMRARETQNIEGEIKKLNLQVAQLEQNRLKYQKEIQDLKRSIL